MEKQFKTHEQKVLMTVTVIFWVVDVVILVSGYSLKEKIKSYEISLILRFVLRLLIFSLMNKKHFLQNVVAAIPFAGPIYATYFFFFGENKNS